MDSSTRRDPLLSFHSANTSLKGLQLVHFLVESRYWFPVWVVFLQDEKGLSLFDIALADAFFRAVVVILEFPCGVLGDRLGHRRTYTLGVAVLILAFLGVPLVTSVGSLLVVWLIWGIALALISGVDSAYAYELLRDAGAEERSIPYFSRLNAIGASAHLLTILAAGFLYELGPSLPFLINAVCAILATLVLSLLFSPARKSGRPLPAVKIMKQAMRCFAQNTRLLGYGVLQTFLMVALWTPTFVLQPFLAEKGVPTSWIGIVFVGAYALGGIYGLGSLPLARHIGLRPLMLTLPILMALGTVGMGCLPGSWYLIAIFTYAIPFYLGDPILKVLIHREVDSSARASVLSGISLFASLCMILTRPLAGIVANQAGSPVGLLSWGCILTALAIVTVAWLWKKQWPESLPEFSREMPRTDRGPREPRS